MSQIKPIASAQSDIKIPTHQEVFLKLRAAVLFGDLKPGQAVTIQGLTAMLGAGATPVREGLRRLVSQGGIQRSGSRRMTVPKLSEEDISQLEFMRLALEPELVKRFTLGVNPRSLKRLKEIDALLNQAIQMGDIPEYLRQNHRFHTTIYAGANAQIIAETTDRLWLRFGPSLRVVCGRFGTQNLPDKHHELLEALQRKDANAAQEAMIGDIKQGMAQIRENLTKP